jgi:hypothetical protein
MTMMQSLDRYAMRHVLWQRVETRRNARHVVCMCVAWNEPNALAVCLESRLREGGALYGHKPRRDTPPGCVVMCLRCRSVH